MKIVDYLELALIGLALCLGYALLSKSEREALECAEQLRLDGEL